MVIARALLNTPRIVFADEPIGVLDSQTGLAVYGLLREIHRQENATFVIGTHERTLAK